MEFLYSTLLDYISGRVSRPNRNHGFVKYSGIFNAVHPREKVRNNPFRKILTIRYLHQFGPSTKTKLY